MDRHDQDRTLTSKHKLGEGQLFFTDHGQKKKIPEIQNEEFKGISYHHGLLRNVSHSSLLY